MDLPVYPVGSTTVVGVVVLSEDQLFSEHWYRVRNLKPRLASDVDLARHVYRGVSNYVLHRRSSNSFFRLDDASYQIVSQFDGSHTVADIWQGAIKSMDASAPNQQQFINLLGQLHEAELLTVNRKLDAEHLFIRGTENSYRDAKQRYTNPLFLRLRLINPDKILSGLLPVAHLVFSAKGFYIWFSILALAVFKLLPHLSELAQDVTRIDFFSPAYAALFLVIYPPLKLLHEFAHGLALKRFGGEAREMGIALMVLLPVPYIDASAAAIFPNKYHRMLVSAAGIFAELGVAALATLVWLASDGTVHDIALMLMLICGMSTVLFNANPLLKFDGYYLLADAIEIPNLADRSKRYVLDIMRSWLLGLEAQQSGIQDCGERAWLIGYGILSTLYRVGLMLSIAYVLSGAYFFFGAALALLGSDYPNWLAGVEATHVPWHTTSRFTQAGVVKISYHSSRYRAGPHTSAHATQHDNRWCSLATGQCHRTRRRRM